MFRTKFLDNLPFVMYWYGEEDEGILISPAYFDLTAIVWSFATPYVRFSSELSMSFHLFEPQYSPMER
jgi:hypothetical protein